MKDIRNGERILMSDHDDLVYVITHYFNKLFMSTMPVSLEHVMGLVTP